ncbi:MAG: hypothetical protein J6V20_00465 [Bacteroidaceae bacterium]|nr:hypothetical protein [Bacteroidaceae bacterium]
MKKIFSLLFVLFVASATFAQENEASLFERVAKMEKKQDWFNLYLNMQGSFDATFNYGGENGFNQGKFYMRQFRIEATGHVTDWLWYRWRQRLNRHNNGNEMIDNLPESIDYAAICVRFNKNFSLFAGKQGVAYGGFEYDANPIDIYQYSNMIDYMNNFMTGVTLTYDINPNQQLAFQILDSRNKSQSDTYGINLEESRLPLVYTLNWNANMCDNKWQTRYSASVMEEVKGKYMYYLALGNQFNFSEKCNMYFDIMSSLEQLDRKGMITNMTGGKSAYNSHNAYNTLYNSFVAKVNYRFLPKWNFFAKGMYDMASVFESEGALSKGNYSSTISYIGGIEYYPMTESNLHFFLAFIGQTHLFTDRAKTYGNSDYSTQRLSLGFIYKLPMF